jgi:restriction system protein
MALWGVRAGSHGEGEEFALNNAVATIGYGNVGDASRFASLKDIKEHFSREHPSRAANILGIWAGQIWSFVHNIKEGDLIALPRKGTGLVAFGEVTGPYRYDPSAPDGLRQQRPVKWLDTAFARTRLDEDILNSLGSLLTVFRVKADGAERRIRDAILGKKRSTEPSSSAEAESEDSLDVTRAARDRIITHIGRKFRGHDLERLVEAVLKAQGFVTNRTPPGADGGVDILAGRGQLGFEPPRLAVQVKSSESPTDVSAVRELQGVMRQFSADLGLFVSWGGFRGTAPRDARRDFFQLRLWSAEDLLDQLLEIYEKLPGEIQAELPLKRVWTLVEEGGDD